MKESDVIAALGALAHQTRLRIFRLLVTVGPEGLSVGRIGAEIGGPADSTLSFHLSDMRQAGLLRCRREGRSLIYAADFEAMTALLGFLTENCCQGKVEPCCALPAAEKIDG